MVTADDFERVLDILDSNCDMSTKRACEIAKVDLKGFRLLYREREDLYARYEQVKKDQVEEQADQLVALADDMEIPEGHKRHMIDVRKFRAVRLLPQKYGDRQLVEHGGTIGFKVFLFDPEKPALPAPAENAILEAVVKE